MGRPLLPETIKGLKEVHAFVVKNPGTTAMEMNAKLALETKQANRLLARLRAMKNLKSRGNGRQTAYTATAKALTV